MDKKNLCGLNVEEIADIIRTGGFDPGNAIEIANIIYKKGSAGLEKASRISGRLKTYLSEVAQTGIYGASASEVSVDGAIKYLFISDEGKQFESVFIPDKIRKTVCVSTQAGCRMGCPFCVTGKYGFNGNLSAGDIINQIIGNPSAGRVTHVVFMGMGEPMDNLDNVLKAINIITAEWGLAISSRNITVSSVGITSAIEEFLKRSDCNLALSLYSPFPEERIKVIPAEKAYPVQETIKIMADHPLKKKRRLSIAYLMISGINDTDRHLNELIKILKGTQIRVNLLPYHPVKGDTNRPAPDERMLLFKHNLVIAGISSSVRKSRGADISAACGLLASGMK